MKNLKTMLASATVIGAASLAFAAPASAQYVPSPYGYGNVGTNVVNQILGSILGYGTYPYGNYGYGNSSQYGYQNQQMAVNQCARATEAQLNGNQYGYGQNGYYPQGAYGVPQPQPYPQGAYGYPNQPQPYVNRVTGVNKVKRTSYGYHVYGLASATAGYAPQAGQYGTYGQPNYKWDCKVDMAGRIRDIDIERASNGSYQYRRY